MSEMRLHDAYISLLVLRKYVGPTTSTYCNGCGKSIPTKAFKAHIKGCAGFVEEGVDVGDAEREMVSNCENKLINATMSELKRILLSGDVNNNVDDVRILWDICRGLEIHEAAGKLHEECITEVTAKKAKQALVNIKMIQSMANMKLQSSSGTSLNLKVSSVTDEQPHVTAISNLIGEVSQMMVNVVDSGLKGPIGLRCLHSLHYICKDNLVQLIQIFEQDRKVSSPVWTKSELERDESKTAALDLLLDETAIICQLCERYFRHISQLFVEIGGDPSAGKGPQPIEQTHVLLASYIQLEDFYLTYQVSKSFMIEETVHIENVPVSSMAEDAFFILQKVFSRSVATLNVLSPNTAVNHIVNVLDGVYRLSLINQLKIATSSNDKDEDDFNSALLEAIEGVDAFSMPCIKALNTISLSAQYVIELRDKVGVAFKTAFPDQASRIDPSLSELSSTSRNYTVIRDDNMAKLLDRGFSPSLCKKLRKRMSPFDYVLTVQQQTQRETHDPFMDIFIKEDIINNITIQRCKSSMSVSNFAIFLKNVCESLSSCIEAELLSKKFNEMGGIQLQKEIRVLQTSLSTLVDSGSVRPYFSRVNHIVYLLSLTSQKDIQTFPYPKPVLTPEEIKKYLSLRSDF